MNGEINEESQVPMHDRIDIVTTRDDFVAFVNELALDLQENGGQWENPTLERYLEALAAWVNDMDGAYMNLGLPVPTNVDWKTFATALLAASAYE